MKISKRKGKPKSQKELKANNFVQRLPIFDFRRESETPILFYDPKRKIFKIIWVFYVANENCKENFFSSGVSCQI